MLARLSLRLRVFLFFALMALGTVVLIAGGLAFAASRDSGSALVNGGLIAGFLCVALILFVWRLFDENVARAVDRLATQMRARAHSEVDGDFDGAAARYLGDLAPAAGAVASTLRDQKQAVARTVSETTARLRSESDRLSELLADVPAGLMLCTPEHTLAFYNAPVVQMLRDTGRPRLDRSVFDLLRPGPIRQTYARLTAADSDRTDAELMVATTGGGRSLAARMRLVGNLSDQTRAPGYVLTLRDITADLRLHSDRARLLRDTVDSLRQPAATVQALLELQDDSGRPNPALLRESEVLVERINDIAARHDALQETWWPMQEVRASDIIDGLRGQLGPEAPTIDAPHPHLMLRCDGFALTGLLTALVEAVHGARLAEAYSLTVTEDGDGALLALSWRGDPMPLADLDAVLSRSVPDSTLGLTGREILDHHGTDIWPERRPDGRQALVLPINEARPSDTKPALKGHLAERATVFDFTLLNRTPDRSKSGRALTDLTYVVFDTETTGLNPQGGDEIVQIAAVRLMNGRRVVGEVLDQLVDPERPIPPGSTKVHGVTDAMVRGMPTIRQAGAQFHRFCENAVLVAHNAPFDMAFFHRHAPDIGATFDHPVFDTVLLSAILFGQQETHTLDALAERFGVVIPEEDRHTAYGDTVATAEVFQRMLPLLEAKGLDTFDKVLEEMTRNSRLLREMNARVSG
jgi:DNA polymerase-3 subunit epsilon